jgi:hypothetical protein
MQRFNFDDGLSKVMSGKRKNKGRGHSIYSNQHHNNNQTGYPLESDTESLTYSASSSQAGESTDSSSFDYGGNASGNGIGNSHGACGDGGGGNGGVSNYHRQNSGVDSLGYSDDDHDYDAECYQTYGHGGHGGHGATITGQPSDSYANDRRVYTKSPSPKSITHQKSPVSAADFHATHNHHHHHHSSGGSSTNTGSNGSSGTPSTPPPRHSGRKMTAQETEVWYQKWWMCGFTDALNLNQH